MIDKTLLIYALATAGGYLLLISLLLEFVSKKLSLNKGLPEEIIEETNISWFGLNFLMELLFYVAVPTIAYSFIYLILPFEGVRAGMASALFALVLGAVPLTMGLSVRIKLPMPFLIFSLLSYFIKLSGSLIIIGYLYTL
jgi:hypothetical protein